MKVSYYVVTESATFLIYKGEHGEGEITEMNRQTSDFIEVITNAAKSG